MKAIEIYEKALKLLGYIFEDGSYDESLNLKALSIVNAVYADLYFIKNDSGFLPLVSLNDIPKLSERIINDVMPYGVAMHLALSVGDGLNNQIFTTIYNSKRCSVLTIDTKTDVIPSIDA